MKKQPLVSVVMPVYNGEKFLRESIDSILNQSYKNFELIIIDDASIDNSWQIINNYQKKDKRIIAIKNKKNSGSVAKVFIKSLNLIKGKYFTVVGCDDVWMKSRLEKQVNFLENNKEYLLVGSQIYIINEKGKIIGIRKYPIYDKEIRKIIFLKNPFAASSVLVRLNEFKKIAKNGINFPYAEDYYWWFELTLKGKVYNLSDFLIKYRVSDRQIKTIFTKNQLRDTINVQRFFLKKTKIFNWLVFINHFLLVVIYYLMPARLILFIFKKIEYKKI